MWPRNKFRDPNRKNNLVASRPSLFFLSEQAQGCAPRPRGSVGKSNEEEG